MDWWQRNIVEPGKLPLFLCAVAFLLTFATTRTIVRSIRAGRGPFRNISAGGTHVHHVVPGTILMVSGGMLALADVSPGSNALSGVLFGIGLALVLDEFALILHLNDVYWEAEGRVSVDAVFLVAGVLGLLLVGASPEGVDDLSSQIETARWVLLFDLLAGVRLPDRGVSQGQGGLRPGRPVLPAADLLRGDPAGPPEVPVGPLVLSGRFEPDGPVAEAGPAQRQALAKPRPPAAGPHRRRTQS